MMWLETVAYWTNGLLQSTVHRVVFPASSPSSASLVDGETDADLRYCISFFCYRADSSALTPVPSEHRREDCDRIRATG